MHSFSVASLKDKSTNYFSSRHQMHAHTQKQTHVLKKKHTIVLLSPQAITDPAAMFTTGETIRVNLSNHTK